MLAVLTVSGLIYNVGLVASPWFEGQIAQRLADIIGGLREPTSMLPIAVGYVAVVAFVQFMRFIKRLSVRKFSNRVNLRMKGELYQGLLARSTEALSSEGTGSLMTKALSDVDDCVEGMRKFTTELFDTGVAMVAYLVMLLMYDWRLALLSMLFPPISYVLASMLKGVVTRASARAKESMGNMNASTLDRVRGALTYRVFGLERQRDEAYEESLTDYEHAEGKANILLNAPRPLYYAISMLGVFPVIALGAHNVLGTGWEVWDVAAFTSFLSCYTRLTTKSSHAARLFNAVQRARVSWKRIEPILADSLSAAAASEDASSATPSGAFGSAASASGAEEPANAKDLHVRDLSVAFDQGEPVLRGVSFDVPAGSIIGVTGEVASGKSTLGRALIGELAYEGSVTFGGDEVRDLARTGAHRIAYLGHDPELLGATVADNIRLGIEGDVWPCLRMVRLDDEVAALPQREETLVGEGGIRLSGGQRARLGLARALYHRRPLMVLDDPFSAVDMTTEREIMGELRRIVQKTGACIVIISHRLTLFSQLDNVLYLENGTGTFAPHDELLASCPGYANLYSIQTARANGKDLDEAPAADLHLSSDEAPASNKTLTSDEALADASADDASAPNASDAGLPGADASGAGSPGAGASGAGARRHPVLAVVWGVVRRSPLTDIALVLTVALSVATSLLPPLVLERVVNDLTAGEGGEIAALAAAYLTLVVVSSLSVAGRESAIVIFGQKITHAMRTRMAAKLGTLPAPYFIRTSSGALTSRFVNDVNTVEAMFSSGVISMVSDACSVIGAIVVVFTRSVGLGLILLVALPILLAFTRHTQKSTLTAQLDNRVATAEANRQIPETIACLRTVHVYGAEAFMRGRYDTAIRRGFSAMERSNFFDSVYSPVILSISALVVSITVTLAALGETGGAIQVLFGMSVGTAVAIVRYVSQVFDPLDSIGMEIQSIQQAIAGVKRIGEFLNEPEMSEQDQAACRALPESTAKTGWSLADVPGIALGAPAVEMRDVVFAYDESRRVLDGFDLRVESGEHVTIAGRTGAGKSTIMKLMLGLYLPQEGTVRVLGMAPDLVPAYARRRMFGYVEQSFRMVPGTVADQVTLFDSSVSEDEVRRSLEMVGLLGAVDALPAGADEPCRPETFSQGQFQLLSIARAVACDPQILMLDEITANLDSATEAQLMQAIDAAAHGRTVISISHRLYEQSGGRIVRIGEDA